MSTSITCPVCQTTYEVDHQPGSRIRCRRCSETLVVNGLPPAGSPPPARLAPEMPLAEVVDEDADGDVRRPRARRRPAREDDFEDRRGRRRRDDPGDEEDAPSDKKYWVIGGVVVGLLLLLAVATAALQVLQARQMFSGIQPPPAPPVAARPAPFPGGVKQPMQPANPAPAVPDAVPGRPPFRIDPRLLGPATVVYLSDMTMIDARPGPWPVTRGGRLGDPMNRPIVVNGRPSPHGLSMHPPTAPGFARARYALGGRARTFKTSVAFNDANEPGPGPVSFLVLGDGRVLWRSPVLRARNQSYGCQVSVAGVNVLELRVCPGGNNFGSHAVWVEPYLLKTR